MSKLLEEAFAKVAALPEAEQDAIAALVLEELASEARWASDFAASSDALAMLAAEALAEDRAGRTEPLDFGEG